ncbi:phosphoribosylanthranilate isomerase [Ureibacillus sinduriensis]|uniref:N-(5'-phosphoribosyl)anthranilate isomerase n=1 Tax=Ureibacillus sinduriensis BLB-1 = JCM 15800 TaxID=1384057 RepID=A0A0A3HTZ0_9BACL|nr:phosphoribosylanthranilate isomerase [Ureibacillus sinduriensis]KGR75904.1 N-(5'-phosphoribosyl)anthranilate isomerase [Ureibacillus sinduriensis BLB-1 = JCM 15800]
MAKVKICGLKEEEHVLAAVEAGATWIGFMFAPSKRQISIDRAKELAKLVPPEVKTVGVFVNPTGQVVQHVVENVGLDYVQYHGSEEPAFIKQLGYPSIKAISIRSYEDVQNASCYDVDYYLFDAPGTDYAGGSGHVFEWSLLERLSIPRSRVLLAGGLNSDNVARAITQVAPFGVDVSSGVEKKGEKDSRLIKQFIEAAASTGVAK